MKRFGRTKFPYYVKHVALSLLPRRCFTRRLERELEKTGRLDPSALADRVEYYNRLDAPFQLDEAAIEIQRFGLSGNQSAYYYDLLQYLRYFPGDRRFARRFGDIRKVPSQPTFVKSRPVSSDRSNANSVLMKLDEMRHFRYLEDKVAFEEKANKGVFRGACVQEHRRRFVEICHSMPNTDIGDTSTKPGNSPFQKPRLTIGQHLRNKFIISVEGNDVATNLKWIMASNSLCMMTMPKYETWFMEGALVPDQHFVLLRKDYEDLPEKIEYFTRHTGEAREIIANAKVHTAKFFDTDYEKLVALLVVKKYFDLA